MSERWLEGRVIENRHWTDALWSLRVEAPPLGFEAGQQFFHRVDVFFERKNVLKRHARTLLGEGLDSL